MYTVTASQARANFSKLGEEIARTGKTVTVFKNSKPWLVMAPVLVSEKKETTEQNNTQKLSREEKVLFAWSEDFVEEYRDVFEALSK